MCIGVIIRYIAESYGNWYEQIYGRDHTDASRLRQKQIGFRLIDPPYDLNEASSRGSGLEARGRGPGRRRGTWPKAGQMDYHSHR